MASNRNRDNKREDETPTPLFDRLPPDFQSLVTEAAHRQGSTDAKSFWNDSPYHVKEPLIRDYQQRLEDLKALTDVRKDKGKTQPTPPSADNNDPEQNSPRMGRRGY